MTDLPWFYRRERRDEKGRNFDGANEQASNAITVGNNCESFLIVSGSN